jgi:hypothetical protein
MRDGTRAGISSKWALVATQAAALMTAVGCGDSTRLSGTETAGDGRGGKGADQRGGADGASAGAAGGGASGTGGSAGPGGHGSPPPPPMGCQTPAGTPGVWEEVAAPPEQAGFRASDAFAVGTDDLLFAGATFDPASITPASNPRVLRWSHGCWTVEVTIPASGTQQETVSVHGTGPNDLWASAEDQLFHRDAQGWSRFPDESWRSQLRLPLPFGDELVMTRVRAATPSDVWVAVTTHLLHWSGQSWSVFNFNDPTYPTTSASVGFFYNDIWIDAPNDVWFGGPSDQVGNTMDFSFVHHFDGTGFTHRSIGLGSIFALRRGGGVMWLANPTQDFVGGQTVERTLRRLDATDAPTVSIAGDDPIFGQAEMVVLWGRGGAEMWASGNDLAHFDGQSWSLVTDAPAPARNGQVFNNTLVTGDAGAVWLATPGPRFFRKVDGP